MPMTYVDAGYVCLAGLLSCMTPEALLLLPVFLAAIGARNLGAALASAAGIGVCLVVAGPIVAWLGEVSGYGAVTLRWVVCVLMILQGLILLRRPLTEEFQIFTGGSGYEFRAPDEAGLGGTLRQFGVGIVAGANWMPRLTPALGNASLVAAHDQAAYMALLALFGFGAAAALPWIILGRILRIPSRLMMRDAVEGMAGKRLLGLSMLAVAALGLGGYDVDLVRLIEAHLPEAALKLAVMY